MSTAMEPIHTETEALRNEHFVAQFLGISIGTVRRWRYEGRGPKFRKIGVLVRYRLEDLHAFLNSQPVRGGLH